MSDAFNARLAGMPGSRPHRENSEARQRIHDSFAEITAAKKRGVTWQAIADLLNEGGFRSTSGDPLTASQVSAAYSAERSSRGLRTSYRPLRGSSRVTLATDAQQLSHLSGLAWIIHG